MSKSGLTPARMNYILWAIFLAFMIIPAVRPIGIPFPIGPEAKHAYELVQNLPEGSLVFFSVDASIGGWAEVGPGGEALFQHVMAKRHRVVFVALTAPDGPLIAEQMVNKYHVKDTRKYGVDYVIFPYLPGGVTAAMAMADDFWKAFGKDYYGSPLDTLPIMKDVHGAKDFKLAITLDNNAGTETLATQWWTKYKTVIISQTMVMMYSWLRPYKDGGQVEALLSGARHGAEYEYLIKSPGAGMASTDMISLTHAGMVIAVIISNSVYYFVRKGEKK